MKPLSYCIIGVLLIVFINSCKKTEEPATTAALDFSYSGNTFIYDTIKFKSNQPAGTVLKWEFDDGGETSNLESPVHLFPLNKTYTVKLTANGQTVSKNINFSIGLSRIKKVIKWQRMYTHYTNDPHYGGSSVLNFTLDVLDDSSVILPAETGSKYTGRLKYSSTVYLQVLSPNVSDIKFSNSDDDVLTWNPKTGDAMFTRYDSGVDNEKINYTRYPF